MLKIIYAGCLGLYLAISLQSTAEIKCALQSKFAKNLSKTPLLRVQGRSKILMLINLKILSPVLVMVSSIFLPICNRFHTRQANNGKITSFRGCPFLTPSFEGSPSPRATKLSQKLESLGQPTTKIS